jgi:phospholipid/cholesterol/gamma-HCH transport system substrate-binding protein
LKVSNEFKTGLVVILTILLLIFGVNYLKGNSFFGGDDIYFAYFPSSGSLAPSSSVTLNGVEIGKVLSVKLVNPNEYVDPKKRILVKFSVQNPELKLAVGSEIEILPGVLSTGIQIQQNFVADKGYFDLGDTMQGTVSQDLANQLETELLPLKHKMENLMVSVDNIVGSINNFWDTSAAFTMDQSLNEARIAISRFGRVAYNLDNLIDSEKSKISSIFSKIESIAESFKETDLQIKKVVGNVAEISDTILSLELKQAFAEAKTTMVNINSLLEASSRGEGTLGKLLNDEQLYNELNETNQKMQDLVEDIKLHPERYIHFSVFGAKSKGVPLNKTEEKKLKEILENTP